MLSSSVEEAKKYSIKDNLMYLLAFKKNALMNKLYNSHFHPVQLSECPMEQYVACFLDYKKFMPRKVDALSLEFLDDPVRGILVGIATPSYDSYVFAAIIYETMRRLVMAKYHIEKTGLKVKNCLPANTQQEIRQSRYR